LSGPTDLLPPRTVELSLMFGNFDRNKHRMNSDPRYLNNFNPNYQFRGNFSRSNRGYRGRGNNFNFVMNVPDMYHSNNPSAFELYDDYTNNQVMNPAHVNARYQNAQAIQPSTSTSLAQIPANVPIRNSSVSTSASSLNMAPAMNSVVGGSLSIQGMPQPITSMTTATNSTQAAPALVQSTSVAVTNQASGPSQSTQPDQQQVIDDLNKQLAAANFRITQLGRPAQNPQASFDQGGFNQLQQNSFPNQDFRQNFRSNYRGRFNNFRGNRYGQSFQQGNQFQFPTNQNQVKSEGVPNNQQPFYNNWQGYNQNQNPPLPSPTRL